MTALQKPGLRNLLAAIGLDVTFERAVGDLLYYRDDEGQEIEVLDLVGGYGTLLLGHNHPELIALATRFFCRERSITLRGRFAMGP